MLFDNTINGLKIIITKLLKRILDKIRLTFTLSLFIYKNTIFRSYKCLNLVKVFKIGV